MFHIKGRERVLSALEKDISRRYISICSLQADGRLQLDKACLDILQPRDGEVFSLVNDKSSIIITRKPSSNDNVISTTKWDNNNKRLRLPSSALRILLACTVGVRVFIYNGEIALEVEPFLQIPEDSFFEAETVEQLAPYVLRPPRSIFHIDIANYKTVVDEDIYFRSVGEFWPRKWHQDPLDKNLKWYLCSGEGCIDCRAGLPIVSNTFWFPCIVYSSHKWFPRPALFSARWPAARSVFDQVVRECGRNVETYKDKGIVSYAGDKLFRLFTSNSADPLGCLNIDTVDKDVLNRPFTMEEKGLMKIAHKELQSFITEYEMKIRVAN